MAFHDPAPALRSVTVNGERFTNEDRSGLARQLLDAFDRINDLQLQINELRRRLDVKPGQSLLAKLDERDDDEQSDDQSAAPQFREADRQRQGEMLRNMARIYEHALSLADQANMRLIAKDLEERWT